MSHAQWLRSHPGCTPIRNDPMSMFGLSSGAMSTLPEHADTVSLPRCDSTWPHHHANQSRNSIAMVIYKEHSERLLLYASTAWRHSGLVRIVLR